MVSSPGRRRGAVAAGDPATVDTAASILEAGGNAIDAALAAMCAACVSEPVLASLGGGGFMLAAMETGRHGGREVACDFFVQTPLTRRPPTELDFRPVFADFGSTRQEFNVGLGSMATPGVVAGLFEIHGQFGRMPIRDIIEPAIRIARDGIRLTEMQARIIDIVSAIIRADSIIEKMFADPSKPDSLLGAGDIYASPSLADFLDVLGVEGSDLFYRGEIAQTVATACSSGGGYLTVDDFRTYQVVLSRPLRQNCRGFDLRYMPLPSLGGVLVALSLNYLAEAGIGSAHFGEPNHARLLAEAIRLAGKAREDLTKTDHPSHVDVERILSSATLAAYRQSLEAHVPVARGTTHISVIDGDGNAASLSISNGEGAAYVVPETGIIMNNMLGEADINPRGFHAWPTGVRLHSMMTPSIARRRDGSVLVLGSGGSNRIRSAILQVLVNVIVFDMPIDHAVSAPRLHFEDDRLDIEPGFADRIYELLKCAAQTVAQWPENSMFFGGVHCVHQDGSGVVQATGDSRRGGDARIF